MMTNDFLFFFKKVFNELPRKFFFTFLWWWWCWVCSRRYQPNFSLGVESHTWAPKKYYIRQAICQNYKLFWGYLGWAQSIWKLRYKKLILKLKLTVIWLSKMIWPLKVLVVQSYTLWKKIRQLTLELRPLFIR